MSSVHVTFCSSCGSKRHQSNTSRERLGPMEQCDAIFVENHTTLNDTDSNRSSNRCHGFRGHNSHLRVTVLCTLLAKSFFPPEQFYFVKYHTFELLREI